MKISASGITMHDKDLRLIMLKPKYEEGYPTKHVLWL